MFTRQAACLTKLTHVRLESLTYASRLLSNGPGAAIIQSARRIGRATGPAWTITVEHTPHAFDFLATPNVGDACLVVAYGADPFLKGHVLTTLRDTLLGDSGDEAPFSQWQGDECQWRDVADELSTRSLFGGDHPQVVVLREADRFVTQNRSHLESLVEKHSARSVLVLDVKSWPGNTRLAKAANKIELVIACQAPERKVGRGTTLDTAKLANWLSHWAEQRHQLKLSRTVAQDLVDLVGPQLGLLDQGLAKLALFLPVQGKVTVENIQDVVGGWRAKTTWDLLDDVADGKAADALGQLDRLLLSGEKAHAMFGAFSWSLRRFAVATRLVEQQEAKGQRVQLRRALEQAGFRQFPKGALEKAERQLRQLGRDRAAEIFSWLLEADLRLKGSHSQDARSRRVLEELIFRLSSQARSNRKASH